MEKAGKKYTLPFGKYKDYTLDQMLSINPSYIVWLHDNDVLHLPIKNKLLQKAIEGKSEADRTYRIHHRTTTYVSHSESTDRLDDMGGDSHSWMGYP